jgi:hypothetical protein
VKNCGGNHILTEIMRTGYKDDIQHVVRWCRECGAVVVDGELDGRVRPGAVMEMRFPANLIKDQ